MIIVLIVAVIILIVAVFCSKPKNNVESNIEKLKDLSVKELDQILLGTATAIILHDETVKRVGKEQADRICKYEEYGCTNYAEVKRFHDAVRAERDRKKNNQ